MSSKINRSPNFVSSLEESLELMEKEDLLRIWRKHYKEENNNYDLYRNQIYLFEEEFLPITDIMTNNNAEKVSTLVEGINSGLIPSKDKKLKKLYNILVYVGPVNNKISYQSIDNLNAELTDVISSYPELKTFFSDVLGIISTDEEDENNKSNIATEFLRINGCTANMFKSNNIIIYSALLNYPRGALTSETQELLFSGFENLYNNGEVNATYFSEWDLLSSEFKQFMDQLLVRTINYSN